MPNPPNELAGTTAREQYAEVLAAHTLTLNVLLSVIGTCDGCDWRKGGLDQAVIEAAHRAHVADALAAALPDPEQAVREANCPTQGCRARWDATQEHTCDTEALYERVTFLRDQLERVTQERAEAHARVEQAVREALEGERERIALAIEARRDQLHEAFIEAKRGLDIAARIVRP